MPRRSNLFQDVVAIIHSHMAEGATVEESAMLMNRATGRKQEVDVVITTGAAGHPVVIGVEASSTKRPASVEWVQRMVGKHGDLPTDKLVLVSESGFRPAALKYAEAKGVLAIAPADLAADDPPREIVNLLRSIWPKVLSLTPERGKVAVLPPGAEGAGWFHAPPDLDVFLDDGSEVGALMDVARALINANFPKVAEQIELGQIENDLSTAFVLEVGPGWRVKVDGEERRLCARYIEGNDVELHTIDRLQITGKAEIKVSEISLTHRRLGEVTYAYGEGSVGGQDALFLVTENKEGGKATIRFRGSR